MSFFNSLWYEKTLSSCVLQIPLLPLSSVFAVVAAARRSMYSNGFLKQKGPIVPVVVVGGITAGGTGKTPLCIALVNELKQRGFKPGVLTRGYKSQCTKHPCQVPYNGDVVEFGDEPCLIRRETRVPVVIDPERARGADYLVSLGVDVIITDDGLQHYSLDRDVEICVLDGARMLGNGHLLPAGPLREPQWRLKTVDTIVVTGAVAHLGHFPMMLKPTAFVPLNPESHEVLQPKSRVCALAGIGNPDRFFKTLEDAGYLVEKKVALGDHERISTERLEKLAQELPVIMTSKDAIKYQGNLNLNNIFVCKVKANLNKQFFDDIANKIKQTSYKVAQRRKQREENGYVVEAQELIDQELILELNALDEACGINKNEQSKTLKTIINPEYEAQQARNAYYKELKAQSIAKAYAQAEQADLLANHEPNDSHSFDSVSLVEEHILVEHTSPSEHKKSHNSVDEVISQIETSLDNNKSLEDVSLHSVEKDQAEFKKDNIPVSNVEKSTESSLKSKEDELASASDKTSHHESSNLDASEKTNKSNQSKVSKKEELLDKVTANKSFAEPKKALSQSVTKAHKSQAETSEATDISDVKNSSDRKDLAVSDVQISSANLVKEAEENRTKEPSSLVLDSDKTKTEEQDIVTEDKTKDTTKDSFVLYSRVANTKLANMDSLNVGNNAQDLEEDSLLKQDLSNDSKERPIFGKRTKKSSYDPHALPSELKRKLKRS